MATSGVIEWTVVVVVEEDGSLNKTYNMSPTATLLQLMQKWKEDFELIEHWVFRSANVDDTYYEGWMTLEMLGESLPRMVCLKAEISNEPASRSIIEIFVHLKDKFYHLYVKPQEKIYDIAWELPGKPKCLEYNGATLNLNDTVQQAGLLHKSVIRESLCSLSVKLSSGVTVVVKMPSDNLVFQLKEKVDFYERDEFSLRYRGRHLRSEERIADIKHEVSSIEVSTAEFVVNVNDQCIKWKTKDESISISEFISQLAVKGSIETKEVEAMEFVCIGCQRRIRHSDDDVQYLSVRCCKERSMKLNAVAPSDAGTEANDLVRQINSLHEHLVESRSKGRTATFRCLCRQFKDKFAEEGLEYSVLTRCSGSLLRTINDLEKKIKDLNVVLDNLKTGKSECEKEIERLQTTNMKKREEIETLKKETKKMIDENKRITGDNQKLSDEIKRITGDNQKLSDENKSLKSEQIRGAIGPGPSRPPTRPDEERGVKLLLCYHPGNFSSASCPEVTSCGQWPFDNDAYYVTCHVPGIRPGSTPFGKVVAVLEPLFSRGNIGKIGQCLGSVAEDGDAGHFPGRRRSDEVGQEPFLWPRWRGAFLGRGREVDGAVHSSGRQRLRLRRGAKDCHEHLVILAAARAITAPSPGDEDRGGDRSIR